MGFWDVSPQKETKGVIVTVFFFFFFFFLFVLITCIWSWWGRESIKWHLLVQNTIRTKGQDSDAASKFHDQKTGPEQVYIPTKARWWCRVPTRFELHFGLYWDLPPAPFSIICKDKVFFPFFSKSEDDFVLPTSTHINPTPNPINKPTPTRQRQDKIRQWLV